MAVSTITLQTVLDVIAAKGIPDPRNQSQGYGDALALRMASQVMADLITERFNWKFNRAVAFPIYTNSWQQDYPQPKQTAGLIAWGEDCDICDINNTQIPKPLNWNGPVKWRQALPRTSMASARPRNITWMYNDELSWGTWPGAQKVIYPLVSNSGPIAQNPILNFRDANGNYLILSTFGTTGLTQPSLPANSVEGTTVTDGSCVWSVVDAKSQGFRIDTLPGSTSNTYQLTPTFQLEPPEFTDFMQKLTPIPDSFSRHFENGMEEKCIEASPNPGDRQRGQLGYTNWLKSMETIIKQANKNQDVYGMQPVTSPVESRYGWSGARTADNPF